MTDTTATHYEVSYRPTARSGVVRERFPFADGVYGEARNAAIARARALFGDGAAGVEVDLVKRTRILAITETRA